MKDKTITEYVKDEKVYKKESVLKNENDKASEEVSFIPFNNSKEIEDFMTPELVQEFLEDLQDKNFVAQCKKATEKSIENAKKPFFFKSEK